MISESDKVIRSEVTKKQKNTILMKARGERMRLRIERIH